MAHAGGYYLFHWLSFLARANDVALVTCEEIPPEAETPPDVTLHHVERAPVPGPFTRATWKLRQLSGYKPNPMQLHSIAHDSKVLDLIRWAEIVDIQWSDYVPLVHLVRRVAPATPVVATEHDIYAQAIRRDVPDSGGRSLLRRRAIPRTALMAEIRHLKRCDLVYVFNPGDVEVLEHAGLRVPIRVAEPYLDVPDGTHPLASVPGRVIFVGAFTRQANRHAATWFVREVWPAVRANVPEATLLLVGIGSESVVAATTSTGSDGVSASGYVEDLSAFYDTASLAVAPLFAGAGLKFKVAQAMAYGLPVVATSLAVEGFVERGAPVVIADTAPEFVDRLSALLAAPHEARKLGHLSREWVGGLFDFARFMDEAEQELAALVGSAC